MAVRERIQEIREIAALRLAGVAPDYGYRLGISWSGEASENFAETIKGMTDWYVRLTTQDGEEIEAVIVRQGGDVPIDGDTWFDAVTYLPADEQGIAIEGAEERTVRVENVHVY